MITSTITGLSVQNGDFSGEVLQNTDVTINAQSTNGQKTGFKWTVATINTSNGHQFTFWPDNGQLELNLRGIIQVESMNSTGDFNLIVELFDEYEEGFVKIIENNKIIYNLLVKN